MRLLALEPLKHMAPGVLRVGLAVFDWLTPGDRSEKTFLNRKR
jgi:hypothetical protein